MIQKLETEKNHILAVEIQEQYVDEDLQKFKDWFIEKLEEGYQQINILFKIDKLPIKKISMKTMLDDSIFSVKHLNNCGHLAMVGHSTIEKVMVGLESLAYNRQEKGRLVKYFDVEDIDLAWEFVV